MTIQSQAALMNMLKQIRVVMMTTRIFEENLLFRLAESSGPGHKHHR